MKLMIQWQRALMMTDEKLIPIRMKRWQWFWLQITPQSVEIVRFKFKARSEIICLPVVRDIMLISSKYSRRNGEMIYGISAFVWPSLLDKNI